MLPSIKPEATGTEPAASDIQPWATFDVEPEADQHAGSQTGRIVISAAFVLFFLGTLTVLILVFQPFTGPGGGCGGG